MAITSRPQDKFAFLFTGPTVLRFVKDLENVFAVLTQYYNYPAANITVVLGSTPSPMPSFPGATVTTIASTAELDTALTTFAATASGPALNMPGFSTTALLYFTGGGDNSTGPSTLLTDGGSASPTNTVDAAWLTTRLDALNDCHVNVVMQQAFSGGLLSALTGSTLSQWSFTHSCSAAEGTAFGDNTDGSFFTYGWVKGLKCEVLPAGTPNVGQYADTLGSAGESTNYLVSLEEAKEFGKQVHDALGFSTFATPGYGGLGGAQYPGLPSFFIRDGSPAWWESPDIYLTHPNHPEPPGDLYIPDAVGAVAPFNNTITVEVRNVGTHPVRRYSLGIELFKTGVGPTTVQQTVPDKAPASGLLLPMDMADIGNLAADVKDITEWNTAFTTGTTHECIKAEAKLLSASVDFAWNIVVNDFEGQRNTDQMPLPPAPPMPTPMMDIQGMKKHVYGLYNRFDATRRFAVVFPPAYEKFREQLDLTWFAHSTEKRSEDAQLRVIEEPQPHLLFTLKAGEAREILLRAQMKRGFETEGEIRLPFAIVVDGEQAEKRRAAILEDGREAAFDRERGAGLNQQNFTAVAGFTVVIRQAAATLNGTVLDKNNRPAAGAKVFLRTVDGLQGAVIAADDNGRFEFANINPDVYRVRTEAGNRRSAEQILLLGSNTQEKLDLRLTEDAAAGWTRVKVMLDRIRIMRDYDPLIKGKGELVFTSVIVPDNDETAKQVMRLPGSGVYSISDKPGENDLELGVTLFEGVVKNGSLAITIGGQEMDFFDPDDDLTRYRRDFSGNPETWFGDYRPGDEYLDKEDVGDWALWYRIVRG
jgi:hypothetical protein